MSKVIADLSMSLDGFIAGPNAGPHNNLGDGGMRIHRWVFDVEAWRERQGAFILAKATGGAEIAADSIDHLHRYIEMLFGAETEQAKHRTEGDSK